MALGVVKRAFTARATAFAMPIDRKRYPDNWNQIAEYAKVAAGLSCQHCGRHCLRPGEKKPSLTRSEWNRATLSVPERQLQYFSVKRDSSPKGDKGEESCPPCPSFKGKTALFEKY